MRYYFVGPTATGNATALSAMQHLGFSARLKPTERSQCVEVDAVGDEPVGYWFRRGELPLDGVELVMTVRRDIDAWLGECERRCGQEVPGQLSALDAAVRREMFGQLEYSAGVWRAGYERHLERCQEVSARVGKVLHTWDVVAEPSWEFLCRLTGRRAPERPFPFHKSDRGRTPDGASREDGRLRRAAIQVRPSPLGGRGVFAAKPIRAGALIEECPLLLADADSEDLENYVIGWGEDGGRMALPLGYGACYNHADKPNANWQPDEVRALMVVWAERDIEADEEILISYGPEWFPTRGWVPSQHRAAEWLKGSG